MARKRLNKKVALIGSAVFVFLVLTAVGVILYLSRAPETFIRDGDVALLAKDYDRAERNYHKARHLAKTDELRIEMLFKLADLYRQTGRWNNVQGCWNEIIRIDPKNVQARFGRLRYFYIMADSGVRVWQDVREQASELIEVAGDADLFAEDTARWKSPGLQAIPGVPERMGPYLYLLRGRAVLEMTVRGAVTDPDDSLSTAVDDLEKARELDQANPQVYRHLARAVDTKGKILSSRGNLEDSFKAVEQAKELLVQAVQIAPDDPRAHINLLTMNLILARPGDREQIQSLEPEYLSLVEKFDSSAPAYSAIAEFYQHPLLGPKYLDKAIKAAQKAVELDEENVAYAISAANLHYRKFSAFGEKEQKHHIIKAMELAENALTLPDAQDRPGPRRWANRNNRFSLYAFLANCYIEQVLEQPCTDAQKQEWLADAEQAVHEIEQLFGSGEEPRVVKWQGMLELARGNRDIAIRKLHATYEQLKAPKPPWLRDPQFAQLSYTLAKLFEETTEIGAVEEFIRSALLSGIAETKPEAHLDYADVLLKLRDRGRALSIVTSFEDRYRRNQRTERLRIRALIGAGQFDQAEEELLQVRPADDPDTIKLNIELAQAKIEQIRRVIARRQVRDNWAIAFKGPAERAAEPQEDKDQLIRAELDSHSAALAELVTRLLKTEPNSVDQAYVAAVCNNWIAEGQTSKTRGLVNQFLGHFPDSTTGLFYRQMLSEPQPDKIGQQRLLEIEHQVISQASAADPIRRSMNLGMFHHRNNELSKAAVEFRKVLQAAAEEPEHSQYSIEDTQSSRRFAASYLGDIVLRTEDLELAEQIADVAQRHNIDDCGGKFFAAVVAVIKAEYKDALAKLDECIRQRPVFSRGFMLRSNVNAALGNERASIEDAQKAASLNPLDKTVAKVLAFALYRRNQRLGANVSSDQMVETRLALEKAIALDRLDSQLASFYAEYISEDEPLKALVIRQNLQKASPSMQNAILLGRLATRTALRQTDPKHRQALFAIAGSSFGQARSYDPHNKAMLYSYAQYYRAAGKEKEARQLLLESEDRKLLWGHYLQAGQFADARRVLEQLYKTQTKDSDIVKGLLLAAEGVADKASVKRYSEELLQLEDSMENRLIQIRAFLKTDLIEEAEYRLASFKEKYPDQSKAMLLEALLAMKRGRLKKALELVNRTLQTDREEAVAWRLRGEINLLRANYDQAISDLERSKLLSPADAGIAAITRISLARAYLQAGREEDAITELESVINAPQAPVGSRELLEQIYWRLGRKDALKKFYDQSLKRFPDSVLWCNRAATYAITVDDFGRAEQLYEQAWQKSKNMGRADTDAFGGYLRALLSAGKLDRVFEEAGKHVDGDLAPIAFFSMAEAEMSYSNTAEQEGDALKAKRHRLSAVEYCRKAVEKAEANEDLAFNVLQRMYLLLGAEEVLKYCEERLAANPDNRAANLAMFNLARINGQYDRAVDYINKCLQIAGPHSLRQANYMVKKAEVLQLAYNKTSDNNYLKKAIAEYESLLAKMPNNMDVLNNLSYILAETNLRPAEALAFAKRIVEEQPNNPGFMDTYSYVLYKNGRFSEAAEFSHAAIQQYQQNKVPVPADVYKHLGQICEELGSSDEALAAYKQALEVGADTLPEEVNKQINGAIERLSRK